MIAEQTAGNSEMGGCAVNHRQRGAFILLDPAGSDEADQSWRSNRPER